MHRNSRVSIYGTFANQLPSLAIQNPNSSRFQIPALKHFNKCNYIYFQYIWFTAFYHNKAWLNVRVLFSYKSLYFLTNSQCVVGVRISDTQTPSMKIKLSLFRYSNGKRAEAYNHLNTSLVFRCRTN